MSLIQSSTMNSTTISRSSQVSPMLDTSPASDLVSLRNFVVDEDRANLGSDLWQSLDKNTFILAQRDAFEAYNLARAMRLSEESAAKEERIRLAQAEEAARTLARSWNVDGLQSALLKNASVPSSASSSPPRSSTRHPPSSSSSSRPILNRNPSTAENSSSKVSPPSGTSESSSQQKRRKASISQPQSHPQSQPHYSYSTSNYSYHYPSHNQSNTHPTATGTSQASVHAQQPEGRKHSPSSASSRDIQAGQILNPKESSSRTQSPSSSASAQAAAADREKGKERSRSNSNSNSNSSSSSRKRSSSSAGQQGHVPQAQAQAPQVQVLPQTQSQLQSQAQTHQQQHGPRDIFAPIRFNCAKCGNLVSSVVLSQPSLALTSPDPFAHPFASALHVVCNNPSCGAVHCRGCLQVVKCRDVEHAPSPDSQALIPISSSSSSSPPASNPTSPIRPTFTFSKSHPHTHTHTQAQSQRACAGGPGCTLWTCCPTVRAIAIWEALRAFDALFGAEAGFQVANQQWKGAQAQTQTQTQGQGQGEAVVGRQHREAYIKLVISKADKSMRRFEDGFVRVLKVVASWLLQVSAEPCAQFGQDGGSRPESTVLDESPDRSQSPDTLLLLHLARLFLSSHLLEVVHTFLGNRNVKDWMAHAETYLDVLDVVGKMMDCGLGFLLKEVSGVTSSAPSSLSSAPSSGFYNPFAATPPSSSSPSQSPPFSAPGGPQPSPPPLTLYDLVSQLESYRGELKKFLAKVSFGVTVDKASKLHEAITYLVLQLVVGEF